MTSPSAKNSRLLFTQAGKHASATDVTAASAGLVFLEPVSEPTIPYDVVKYERNLLRGDGENYSRKVAHKNVSNTFSYQLEVRGISGGAGDSTSSSYATKTQIGLLLDTVCVAAGSDATGETTSASDAGSGTTVTADASSSFATGDAIMVEGTTSGKLTAREVVSVAAANITVCRALTDDGGNADTANESSVIYAAASWYVDADGVNPVHHHHRFESTDMRLDYYGCAGNAVFNFPTGGDSAKASFTWNFSDVEETTADEDPTFSAQSAGDPVVAVDSQFFIGSTLYDAWDLNVDLGAQIVPKKSISGANGVNGYAVTGFSPTISGKLFFNETLLATLQGATAQDVLLQVGRTAGSTILFRMPAADFDASRGAEDGLEIINFTCRGTRPSAGNGSLRIHLF